MVSPFANLTQVVTRPGWGFALVIGVLMVCAVRTRLRKGWMIGVVRAGDSWRGDKVVYNEVVEELNQLSRIG